MGLALADDHAAHGGPRSGAGGDVFYGFGTVAWYAAMLGSTWFPAHVVASFFLLLGITLALDGERREAAAAAVRRLPLDGRQLLAGLRLRDGRGWHA